MCVLDIRFPLIIPKLIIEKGSLQRCATRICNKYSVRLSFVLLSFVFDLFGAHNRPLKLSASDMTLSAHPRSS